MLFFVILLGLYKHDYSILSMPKNEEFKLHQQNYSYVLFSESPLLIEVQSSIFDHKYTINPYEYTQIDPSNLTIFSSEKSVIRLWKIPDDLCNLRSIIIFSDFKTHFYTNISSLPNDFCFFSQFDAISFYANINFQSSNKECQLYFYNSVKLNDQLPFICHSQENCQYHSASPFFIRFSNCEGSSIKLDFTNQVARNSIKSHECSIATLKTISSRGQFKFNNPLGELAEFKCIPAFQYYQKFYIPIIIAIIVIFSMICCPCCVYDTINEYQRLDTINC